jgi:perosamine synthetase
MSAPGRPPGGASNGAPNVHALLDAVIGQGASGNAELVFEYEDAAADHFEAPWAISMSSGTAAIYAALVALGVATGDEVLLPCTAPSMSLLPILAVGATPVLVDVRSPRSFGMSEADVSSVLGERTRAAMFVPMWGYWDESPETLNLLAVSGIPSILDASQAHHLRVGGRPLTALADVVCLSTHARKPLSTGEGGLLLTARDEIASAGRSVRNFGQAAERHGRRLVPTGPFGTTFGVNLKLNGLGAALGLAGLAALPADYAGRRAVADVLRESVDAVPGGREQRSARDTDPGLYGFCFSVEGVATARLADAIGDLIEVETARYGYDVLSAAPVAARFVRPFPAGRALVARLCSLRLQDVNALVAQRVGDRIAALDLNTCRD